MDSRVWVSIGQHWDFLLTNLLLYYDQHSCHSHSAHDLVFYANSTPPSGFNLVACDFCVHLVTFSIGLNFSSLINLIWPGSSISSTVLSFICSLVYHPRSYNQIASTVLFNILLWIYLFIWKLLKVHRVLFVISVP